MFTGLVEETGRVVAREPSAGAGARLTIAADQVLTDARDGDSIAVNGVCLTVAGLRAPDPSAPGTVSGTAGQSGGSGKQGSFSADVMPETLARSALGGLVPGDLVNLERAARVDARLGGHIVQGHVDGVGRVARIVEEDRWTTITISVPAALSGYLAQKGSITVDGVSLTVSAVSPAGSTDRGHETPDGDSATPDGGAAPSEGGAATPDPAALVENRFAATGERAGDWFQVSLIPTTLQETTLGRLAVGDLVNLEVDVIAKYVERLLAVRSA